MGRILGAGINWHDHNWYDGKYHHQSERYSRIKRNNYPNANDDFYQEVFSKNFNILALTCPDYYLDFEPLSDHKEAISDFYPKNLYDFYLKDNIYYIDHHQSHAIYALFSSGFEEADTLVIDSGAAKFKAIFVDKNGKLTNIGKDAPLGWMWVLTGLCIDGAYGVHYECGKLMGLSGYGEINSKVYNYLNLFYDQIVDSNYEIDLFYGPDNVYGKNYQVFLENNDFKIEDIAATLQQFTLDTISDIIPKYKTSNNLCVSGGTAYNGYMNEMLLEYYDEVFAPPAVGDEGQSIGIYMHADYVINSNIHKPSVYAGKEHIVNERIFEGMKYKQMPYDEIYEFVAKEIANGAIVGWYQGKSESGNRALGNRSIVADPRNPEIKNIINHKVKLREDFRPFAPSVLEEHYQEYFDTNQPSPYMSRIMPVHEDKKSVIPGVVHVDGTARIQTVTPEQNLHWYNLINAFHKETGVPMVVNTSFNCQEPIVETPEDAMKTFKKVALDILVINDYVVVK